ncbi:MAG: four helix bundle protein [Victivallales bacterium]|jgi:restriction system protein|nr:four helix bundle protein [Victivallales bacterium]MBT7303545.1 four helix bundle protein [Victivallales bacterium]
MPKGTEGSVFRPHGGYRSLRSFQVSERIYDATVAFCDRFIDRRSRTHDQMVQAARSGRQNIAEGSRASAASAKSELMLVNVARASPDELLLDYEDYLRQRGLRLWTKDDVWAKDVRSLARRPSDPTDPTDSSDPYSPWLHHADPAIVANTVVCLIHQANYLLDRQLVGLEQQFTEDGGFSERLSTRRREVRDGTNGEVENRTAGEGHKCPSCGGAMVRRTARKGARAGKQFWGCQAYPDCRGTRDFEPVGP